MKVRECFSQQNNTQIIVYVLLTSVLFLLLLNWPQWEVRTNVATIWPASASKKFLRPLSLDALLMDGQRHVFFIETNDNLRALHSRLYCAFESASRMNPSWTIYVIFDIKSRLDTIPAHFDQFENVHFVTLDFEQFVEGSKIKQFWPQIKSSHYPLQDISDCLRLLLLHRFGGLYLDSDVISVKRPDEGFNNFVIKVNENIVNNAIMRFQAQHPFITKILEDLVDNYNATEFGGQGPYLFQRVMENECLVQENRTETHSNPTFLCRNVTFPDFPMGYPVRYLQWFRYFDPEMRDWLKEVVTANSTYVHYYNHQRTESKDTFYLNENQPVYWLFQEFCPTTERLLLRPGLGKVPY